MSKKYYDYFILGFLAIVFLIVYLFLYIRPSVLSLSPLKVLSCGNSRLFGSLVERGTVSTLADVEIQCGGEEPAEIKEKTIPAYLILNQPDESINYFFIRELVFYDQFSVAEDLSSLALNQVHPRSTTVVKGRIVPIGFPGIIVLLAGLIKIFTFGFSQNFFNVFAVIFTPLAGVVAPFLAYTFWRNFWNKQTALTASILLFILPPWWYNASRPFQHNLFFLFFLLISLTLYFSILNSPRDKNKSLEMFLCGFFWGLALYVRPSEIIWMLFLALAGLYSVRKKWQKKDFLIILSSLFLVGILFFTTQYIFYGNIFGSGYVKPASTGEAGSIFTGPQGINFLQALILPFGFHPVTAVKTLINYFFVLFPSWFWLILAGLFLLFLDSRKNKNKKPVEGFSNYKYTLFWFIAGLYILIYYGSWEFYDNLVKVPSIGTSYVRYFLPIYVFSLPFGAYFLVRLWSGPKILSKILVAALAVLLFGASLAEVYLKLDGLQQVKETVKQYQEWQGKIYQLTEPNAVIVTRYADKYIFPGRKVIAGWIDQDQMQAIINLVNQKIPVYLYDLKLDQKTEEDLRQKLSVGGVALGNVIDSWDNLELRKIQPR